jgi:uncharacterized protein (TIGR00369 family)
MTPDTVNQQLEKVPFFRFLDFTLTELDDTHAVATMPFAERLIGNPLMEYYHGGIIASFMEAVAAISVRHGCDLQPAKPINLTVDYLRPAVKGPLMAKATVQGRASAWQACERSPGRMTTPGRWPRDYIIF